MAGFQRFLARNAPSPRSPFALPNAPVDVAEIAGAIPEELQLAKGKPARIGGRPELNPMLSAGRLQWVQRQLFRDSAGSDRLRLSNPAAPVVNPYEGHHYQLGLSRSAVHKLESPIATHLDNTISQSVGDPNIRKLMRDSLARVHSLRERLKRFNRWTEHVEAMVLSHSKG